MATRILYQIKVKPTGFLASWRYANIVIDEKTYEITQQDVPGKEHIGLPCISDYNKVSRAYVTDQIITEFCNLDTFQRITVRAEDCTPFASRTIEADVAACGYLGPVPGPANPPRPYGTPTYGLYKFMEFCDRNERQVRIEIEKKSFVGIEEEIEYGSGNPVVLEYQPLSEITDPIHPFEMTIGLTATVNGQFDDLITDDERMFRVTVKYTDTDEMKARGFIKAGFATEPFREAPYNKSIRVTDGLGSLRSVPYPIPYGGKTNLRQTWLDVLAYCYAMTDLDLPIYTQNNLYEAKMDNSLDDDPMVLSTINPLRFSDNKGNIMSCYEVLEHVGRQFTGYTIQADGCWQYIRVPEQVNPVVRRRKYQPDGFFLFAEQTNNLLSLGNFLDGSDLQVLPAEIDMHNAYKRVAVLQKFGFVPSVIFNGDFELWTGTNFPYWIIQGGLDYSRVQNTIPGVNGAPVLVNDYSFQFNEKYDLSKWAQPNDIKVNAGDKITLSFSVGSSSPTDIMDHIYARIILTDGSSTVWLSSPDVAVQDGQLTGVEPVWRTDVQTYTVPIGKGPKIISQFIYTIAIPTAPISGDITVQFFGFIKRENRIVKIGGVLQDKEYPYTPMQIDNISLGVTNVNNDSIPDGVLYISEQQRFFTESPPLQELLFGDNVNLSLTTNVTTAANVLRNSISNIYTQDNSFSTLWYEYGLGSDKLPIANWAAKATLKLYNRPFRLWNGGIMGYFSMVNIFEICEYDNQVYAVMSGSFDLLTNEFRGGILSEMFYKNIPTYNVGMPHTPGQSLPPIFNNPNNPVPVAGTRIFTDEFTQQFV